MFDYIFLGVIQGVFEWIPISSEGVIALISQYLIKDVNALDMAIFLHLGTLFSVLIYFWKDWVNVLMFKRKRLFCFLFISTIFSLIVGFVFYNLIKGIIIGNFLLFITGTGLLLTSYFHKSKKNFNLSFNNLAIVTGVLQGLSVIPGLSRSGSTIFGLSLGKLKPREILKISYMMSVPVVLASSFYLILKEPILVVGWPSLVSSFIVGLISLHFLIRVIEKVNFYKFTLIFGILCYISVLVSLIV